jgi:hypothetical protein
MAQVQQVQPWHFAGFEEQQQLELVGQLVVVLWGSAQP